MDGGAKGAKAAAVLAVGAAAKAGVISSCKPTKKP
jgi:hypothetical protein